MRINHKILSIPPYISTSWKNIASLHVEYHTQLPLLVLMLNNGQRIEIPELELPIIDAIFHAHAKFMEQEQAIGAQRENLNPLAQLEQIGLNFPLKITMGGMEGMNALLQHNPQQSDTPPLPQEILNRIALLTKSVGLDNNAIPEAEPHCNCVHCQIARAIHVDPAQQADDLIEEEVTEEDLKFRTWDIQQISDKLFTVSNPLNDKEKYTVFLGTPVGCTCGARECEHVLAVLRS